MVNAQPRICPEEIDAQNCLASSNLGEMTRPSERNRKESQVP